MPFGKEGSVKLVFDSKELFMSKVVRSLGQEGTVTSETPCR